MALWRLYYHFVWATRERRPLIGASIETELFGYIRGKSDTLGCIVYAIGGVEDHIHLIVSVPPKLSLSDFVQKIKGSSAHHINHTNDDSRPKFAWQRGYGVFSLGSKQLETAIDYVRHQRTHHQQQTTMAALEKTSEIDDGP